MAYYSQYSQYYQQQQPAAAPAVSQPAPVSQPAAAPAAAPAQAGQSLSFTCLEGIFGRWGDEGATFGGRFVVL